MGAPHHTDRKGAELSGFLEIEIIHNGIRRGEQHLVNQVVREALREMGLEWRREFLPLKFKKQAYRRYNYTPRDGDPGSDAPSFNKSYQGRKLRDKGHTLPNVYSGAGRDAALASMQANARATSKRAYVTLPLPVGFNRKHPNTDVNMRRELEVVIRSEVRHLEKLLGEEVERRWQKLNITKEFGVRIAA